MKSNKPFKPYISPTENPAEITVTSILMGILLAIIFGAANAYLGLRVGLTVSASVPAAVVSMGVIRILLRKNSILESNIVQTIGSAGESLAAGAIFTLPALFLWAAEGKMEKPDIVEISLIALIGGLLGVFFMVPLRKALIVQEHDKLPYPEGTACAKVMLAGEHKGASASCVFKGMGFSAFIKFIVDGLKLVPSQVSFKVRGYAGEIGTEIYPAVLSVGFICGPKIASYMFAGGIFSWLVMIPAVVLFGENRILYPGSSSIGEMYQQGGASAIWSTYIRYIGAGALAAGGVISLLKSLPLIVQTFKDTIKSVKKTETVKMERTSKEISIRIVLLIILICLLVVWLSPVIPVTLLGAFIIVVSGFFFATVSSRMVGMVGSSNNPVSGMAIATLLFATILLKLTGDDGIHGMQGAIAIGSIICIIAAIAGDTSQDLKSGYILGATPVKQQIGEVIGIVVSSLAIGATMYLLDAAWGFGSEELGAPQATLMKMLTQGVMEGNLPWGLVFIGIFVALIMELLQIPVLPFAIGVYLPVHLNACIMAGGMVRWMIDKSKKSEKEREQMEENGILFCSGMIAGEGIVGVALAVLAILKWDSYISLANVLPAASPIASVGSIVVLLSIVASLWKVSHSRAGASNEH